MTKRNSVELPSWLDSKSWQDYCEMRKHIRKPMTHRAMELAIRNLEHLKAEGEDPNKVLEQSVFNSWQGLWPVRQTGRQSFNGRGPINAKDAVRETLKNFGFPN